MVKIVEYKYNVLRDDTILKIMNIKIRKLYICSSEKKLKLNKIYILNYITAILFIIMGRGVLIFRIAKIKCFLKKGDKNG